MRTILFVEDEVSLRVALRYQLRGLGETVEVGNREEAFQKIDELNENGKSIDLAIIDLQLPTRNGFSPDAGFEVVQWVESRFPDASVIIVTVRNDKDAWNRAKEHPSVRYFITKPVTSDALMVAARTCLEQCRWPIFVGRLEDEQP
jgi:CheY-like chemotaxis protein